MTWFGSDVNPNREPDAKTSNCSGYAAQTYFN